ncbi:MAG: 4Fe-4S dicluster domain-containing protein, partial [Actinobacteria bacterium]|nr:4Fe-4S dicluster domain-containing protein [Actinomycetota bacterium]
AILFEVDKCVKCRACVVACKRNWDRNPSASYLTGLKLAGYGNAEKIDTDNPVTVKAQTTVDRGPYVRYSCWHCDNPPCAAHCPFSAVKKDPVTGAVYIKHLPSGAGDTEYCQPGQAACKRQCLKDCARGGYPRIDGHAGDGSNTKAYKCMMCYGRLLDGRELADASGNKKPGQVTACVLACPADAVKFGEVGVIQAYASAQGYSTWTFTSGNVIWASKKAFSAPAADPFVEDHISPVLDTLLRSPVGKAVLVPSLFVGGLYALYARRMNLANEAK